VTSKIVVFDLTKITFASAGEETSISGEPGAVSPGSGLLRVDNLDVPHETMEADILDDGSFEAAVSGGPADTYRLYPQVRRGSGVPLDITSEGGATIDADELDCLRGHRVTNLESFVTDLGVPERRDLELENGCGQPVEVQEVSVRHGDVGFSVEESPLPFVLAPGEGRTLEVVFQREEPGGGFDLLFVVTDLGRFVITLAGSIR
jgi:hypothetical protein